MSTQHTHKNCVFSAEYIFESFICRARICDMFVSFASFRGMYLFCIKYVLFIHQMYEREGDSAHWYISSLGHLMKASQRLMNRAKLKEWYANTIANNNRNLNNNKMITKITQTSQQANKQWWLWKTYSFSSSGPHVLHYILCMAEIYSAHDDVADAMPCPYAKQHKALLSFVRIYQSFHWFHLFTFST